MKALAPDGPACLIGEYRLRASWRGGMGRGYLGLSPGAGGRDQRW